MGKKKIPYKVKNPDFINGKAFQSAPVDTDIGRTYEGNLPEYKDNPLSKFNPAFKKMPIHYANLDKVNGSYYPKDEQIAIDKLRGKDRTVQHELAHQVVGMSAGPEVDTLFTLGNILAGQHEGYPDLAATARSETKDEESKFTKYYNNPDEQVAFNAENWLNVDKDASVNDIKSRKILGRSLLADPVLTESLMKEVSKRVNAMKEINDNIIDWPDGEPETVSMAKKEMARRLQYLSTQDKSKDNKGTPKSLLHEIIKKRNAR